MHRLRRLAGVWAGKLVRLGLRLLRRGGTSLPGLVARRVAPDLLAHLGTRVRAGSCLVTGTNGKTTTSRMLATILGERGLRLVHNRSGANLPAGILTALLEATDWAGRVRAEFALLEVDEAALRQVAGDLRPRTIVVTNLFRDQLDRYGELARTEALIREGIQRGRPARLVLNADDPFSQLLAPSSGSQVLFFGLEVAAKAPEADIPPDLKHCPRCGEELCYDRRTVGHLGVYRCPGCGLTRPQPHVRVVDAVEEGAGALLRLNVDGDAVEVALPLPGAYNWYNAAAAIAAAKALGVPAEAAARALSAWQASFGRMERISVRPGLELTLALIKNPIGCTEVLRVLAGRPQVRRILFLINDREADGVDVSWLWDADFELLARLKPEAEVWAGGLRGEDMAVRLKYAGFAEEAVRVVPQVGEAVAAFLASARPGEELWCLPTYTALLDVKRELVRLGLGRAFWED